MLTKYTLARNLLFYQKSFSVLYHWWWSLYKHIETAWFRGFSVCCQHLALLMYIFSYMHVLRVILLFFFFFCHICMVIVTIYVGIFDNAQTPIQVCCELCALNMSNHQLAKAWSYSVDVGFYSNNVHAWILQIIRNKLLAAVIAESQK